MIKKALILCTLLCSSNAFAVMYKCTDDSGEIVFKDVPCSDEQKQEWKKETESEADSRYYREFRDRQHADRKLSEQQWKEVDMPASVKRGILEYLDLVLKDPDSLKDLKWLGTQTDGNNYRTMVFFRAKNSWGAYGISQFIFNSTKDGKVYSKTEVK